MIDRTPEGSRVLCDTCQTPAPPVAEIMAAHGLIRLDWYCCGGVHICPSCPHPRTPAQIADDKRTAQPPAKDRNA